MFDDGDEVKDYSVLRAEGDKLIADSQIAVRKLNLMEESAEQLRRANEISAWKPKTS